MWDLIFNNPVVQALNNWYVMAGLFVALIVLIVIYIVIRNRQEEDDY